PPARPPRPRALRRAAAGRHPPVAGERADGARRRRIGGAEFAQVLQGHPRQPGVGAGRANVTTGQSHHLVQLDITPAHGQGTGAILGIWEASSSCERASWSIVGVVRRSTDASLSRDRRLLLDGALAMTHEYLPQAENLRLWQDSGEPLRWLEGRRGRWNH